MAAAGRLNADTPGCSERTKSNQDRGVIRIVDIKRVREGSGKRVRKQKQRRVREGQRGKWRVREGSGGSEREVEGT